MDCRNRDAGGEGGARGPDRAGAGEPGLHGSGPPPGAGDAAGDSRPRCLVDLNAIVLRMLDAVSGEIDAHAEIRIELGSRLPRMCGVLPAVETTVRSLLAHAALSAAQQARRADDRRGRVTIRTSRVEGLVLLEVEASGFLALERTDGTSDLGLRPRVEDARAGAAEAATTRPLTGARWSGLECLPHGATAVRVAWAAEELADAAF